jgi:predicted Zn-dependent peptidase
MSTVDGRADTLSRYTLQFGDPARAGDRLPGWLSITADEVVRTAAEMLRPQDRVTLTYLLGEEETA